MVDGSIINFDRIGDLAKPAEKLIEKVSAGIGVVYEPTRIRRKAKAEADAREIEVHNRISMNRLLAEAQIEDQCLAKRALTRLVQEEAKSQQNMEDVLTGATQYLNEGAEPENMDDDWLTHFFGKCRAVSNKEMQDLWSRILAGEANHTGSFSRRTVEFVSTVSKAEAEAFVRLCRHVWMIHKNVVPLVQDVGSELCKNNGIHFSVLKTLDSVGLIHFDSIAGFVFRDLPDTVLVSYCGNAFQLAIPDRKKCQLKVGSVLFSPMGQELLRVTQAPGLDGMVDDVLADWCTQGYAPASMWPKQ